MIDLKRLTGLVEQHRSFVRVVVGDVKGSAPREIGAEMCVWPDSFDGTIGGGQLEFTALEDARDMLMRCTSGLVQRIPLGPSLGQCCGGRVTLVFERWDFARVTEVGAGSYFRRAIEKGCEAPKNWKAGLHFQDGWLSEPILNANRQIHIHGAGHVGNTLAGVLAPLSEFEVSVWDTRADILSELPGDVRPCLGVLNKDTAEDAAHFIMTHDHAMDLDLCHKLLNRPCGYIGLIGSATKWARFRSRLQQLGHSETEIARITCPIGDPSLGKAPQAIAIGVAARLLSQPERNGG